MWKVVDLILPFFLFYCTVYDTVPAFENTWFKLEAPIKNFSSGSTEGFTIYNKLRFEYKKVLLKGQYHGGYIFYFKD
jgi:hypothetical protein